VAGSKPQHTEVEKGNTAMKTLSRIYILTLVAVSLCFNPPAAFCGTGCEQAEALFQKASIQPGVNAKTDLLEQAVQLCPTHAKAWNDLGRSYENLNQLNSAAKAYQKANELEPDLGSPLAGLGDVAMEQGRFQEAGQWYKQFLIFLEAEKMRGNPRGLSIFQDEYVDKYERAQLKQEIHIASIDGVVPKATLMRGLKPISPVENRKEELDMQRLTLCIHFDFNSAELQQQGRAQLSELADAMLDPELKSQSFLIEGHSDLFGERDYNHELSSQRARKVREFLSARGVDPKRLQTEGLGETRPLVLKGDKRAQQVNRRVEFVQLPAAE
jgi:outer membrane protein OmpA-like peptidoglycan-associated protein